MIPLNLFFEKQLVGTFTPDDKMTFAYEPTWLAAANAFPISVALPLTSHPYYRPVSINFLENLMPEAKMRRDIERAHQLPENSPYLFLKMFGADLAGALTITVSDKPPSADGQLIPLALSDIADAIKDGKSLYQSMVEEHGNKFSLAGAQDKFCAVYQEGNLYLAQGDFPSTHIVKVDLDFRNSQTVFNEYFCLNLAREVGLPVANCHLIVNPVPLLVVERYDRIKIGESWSRIHQEDFCQAQALSSQEKYQTSGGPSALQNFNLIKAHCSMPIVDLESYLNWLAFNLLVGNNDSHSKNLSLLYREGKISLAPFYDLLSTSVYGKRFDVRFAYKIGETFDYQKIRAQDVGHLEQSLGVRAGKFMKNLHAIAAGIEKAKDKVADDLRVRAPNSTVMSKIIEQFEQRLTHFRSHGGLKI